MGYPYQPPVVLPALAPGAPLPPGYGGVLVTCERGPYLISVARSGVFTIDGVKVPLGDGPRLFPVLPGRHHVRIADIMDILAFASTTVDVSPGVVTERHFLIRILRNSVVDGTGQDATKFGLVSNYVLVGIPLALLLLLLVVCCGSSLLLEATH